MKRFKRSLGGTSALATFFWPKNFFVTTKRAIMAATIKASKVKESPAITLSK